MVTRTLAVRLDSLGDVLVTGPAIRALARSSTHLTLLCGPRGQAAAELLPSVDELLCWRGPWIDPEPDPVDPADVDRLRTAVRDLGFDRAVVFTSYHQSALPMALVLRLAGVPWVGAISEDYPGSLLDVRHQVDDDLPEPERALSLAVACGGSLADGDLGMLGIRPGVIHEGVRVTPYVVLHPGTSAPARSWPVEHWRRACALLTAAGREVVVTGAPRERDLAAFVAGDSGARNLSGRTDLAGLARVLAAAEVTVVANTGPAHLAAAVGSPVVSLFAPTVPSARWAPYGVPRVVLGDQHAACRDTRATSCPVVGHPCLTSVTPEDVVEAVGKLRIPAYGTHPAATRRETS